MIHIEEGFVWIPIPYTPKFKVEIIHGTTTTDVTQRVRRGEFIRRTFMLGIGQFALKLGNPENIYSGLIESGDTVRFYADYNDGSTQKFEGIIDVIRRDNKGNYLEIEGRHIGYMITEKWISKIYSAQYAYSIFTDIISNHFTGYTTTNVSTSVNTSITKSLDSQQVLKIFQDICVLANADGYIDDDLDVHLFPENSIFNPNFAIVTDNVLKLTGFGVDNYENRTKLTVIGMDNEGLPILYTSGTGERCEKPIFNTNITNITDAKDIGDAKLADIQSETPSARVLCYGMLYVNPGDNIMVSVPRQEIHGGYKIIEIKDFVGTEVKSWKSECIVEKKRVGISEIVESRIRKEYEIVKLNNPNNLEYSFNLTFDDSSNIESNTNTEISQGRLQLSSGFSTGEMVTINHVSLSGNDITEIELKIVGEDLSSSTFEISTDGGVVYDVATKNTLYNPSGNGKYLKVKVTLNSDSSNPNPLLESMAILYK